MSQALSGALSLGAVVPALNGTCWSAWPCLTSIELLAAAANSAVPPKKTRRPILASFMLFLPLIG